MDEGDHPKNGLEAEGAARAQPDVGAELRATAGAEPGLGGPQPAVEAARATSSVCPFLRLDRGGVPGSPSRSVDPDHRCVALPAPVALSDTQQSLVCLVLAHLDCPRFVHGSRVPPVLGPSPRTAIPRATLAAAAILAASLVATLAYTAANGGLAVPIIARSPSPSAASAGSPASTPSVLPSAAATTPAPMSPSPSPSASRPAPSPVASGSPIPPSAMPSPTSDRYALLVPCLDRPACFVYTVRAGDNLTSIGLYFGVPFDTILRLNPWIRDPTTIHQGERVVLPPPTR